MLTLKLAAAVAAAPALVLAAAVVAEARAVAAAPALVLAAAVVAKVRAEAAPALPTPPAIEAEVSTVATAGVAEAQAATRGVDAMIEAVIGTKDPPLEIRRVS